MTKAAYDRTAWAFRPFFEGGGKNRIIDRKIPKRGMFCFLDSDRGLSEGLNPFPARETSPPDPLSTCVERGNQRG